MAAKTLTRPQFEALRTAELYDEEIPPSGTPLIDEYLVSARTNTVRRLIRLGLVREIVIISGIDREELVFPVLTYAGELIRATLEPGSELPTLHTVEYTVANAMERPERRPAVATYYPSEEGCKTWREAEARPLKIDGERVSAVVEAYGTRVTVFVGGRIVFEGPVPAEVRTSGDVSPWARSVATAHAEKPAPAPVSVWATNEAGERFEYAHVPNGAPARVAEFMVAARAVSHFRDVSTVQHLTEWERDLLDQAPTLHVVDAEEPARH